MSLVYLWHVLLSTVTTTSFIASEGTDHSLKTSTVAYSQTEASSNTTTTMTALIKSTKSCHEGVIMRWLNVKLYID